MITLFLLTLRFAVFSPRIIHYILRFSNGFSEILQISLAF
ncbi:hypothetical protein HMPREF1986_02487 [Oribacterium sp. oral taxon 078 str. F0263]|nr:hypothetical protein HMPREF1986_02487 [Oribacterium sp. oral taxon 078 str. F0263]